MRLQYLWVFWMPLDRISASVFRGKKLAMKKFPLIILLVALVAPPSVFAFGCDPFYFNYAGLGTSLLGLQLQKLSAPWNPRYSPEKIKKFLATFRSSYPDGTDVRTVLKAAGLECAAAPTETCSYTGVYTYKLHRSNGKIVRSGNRMDVTVNFEQEPWEVQGKSEFLYGGPPNWGEH